MIMIRSFTMNKIFLCSFLVALMSSSSTLPVVTVHIPIIINNKNTKLQMDINNKNIKDLREELDALYGIDYDIFLIQRPRTLFALSDDTKIENQLYDPNFVTFVARESIPQQAKKQKKEVE